MATNKSELEEELKAKRICRFCLSQMSEKLSSIYSRGAANVNSKVPLSVQVMACVSIEVFSNDGMPTWICNDCRMLFEHGYRFKQMCKHAETQLRQFPLTGEWPVPLAKPRIPQMLLPTQTITKLPITIIEASTPIATATETQGAAPAGKAQFRKAMQLQKQTQLPQQQQNETAPKKILNSNPVSSPEPPIPVRMKREYLDEETALFLTKVDNEEELSIDDVQRLIAATNDDEVMIATMPSPKKQPKVLNKYSMRILNKDAEVLNEPRLSEPQVKRDEDGNMAIVTEILDPNDPYETEPDPIKNATPVETNVFPCPHCERSFPLRQLREIHMVNHNRERSFQCGECDKSFFSKYDLQKHTLVHTGDKPFKCTVCGKAFTRGTLLHRHEKTHTDIPKYICIFCEKPFISKEEMEKHSERHRKNRPFQCKVCDKSFAFKQGLDRHEVIHSRIQPYPCQYCDQSFSTPSKLARHLTAHAGKRPYPCKFCSKSYLLSHHLTRHLRSHNEGISQFACNDCKKVYNSRDELIFHSAVHATETLCCPLCKDFLADIDMVTDHIKAHAESESHACEFCDLIFISAEHLQEHTDINHADELIPYFEDDMAQERNTKQKSAAWQEETLEELLIVDLPAGRVHLTADGTIKLEKDGKNSLSERPPSEPEEIDMDVIEEVESIAISEPAKKVRRTCTSISADVRTERATETVKEPAQQSNRKVATAAVQQPIVTATPTALKTKIKIEENKIISPPNTSAINSALKALPKSVSVRKSSSAATATAATVKSSSLEVIPQKAVTEPRASPQKRVLRTSKRLDNTTDKASVSDESSGHTQLLSFKHLTSTGGTDHTTDAANVTPQTGTSGEKVVKMMIGDKKVKVHKITISRAEADAMAKDGRIRIKDGNMILTQAQATKSSK